MRILIKFFGEIFSGFRARKQAKEMIRIQNQILKDYHETFKKLSD